MSSLLLPAPDEGLTKLILINETNFDILVLSPFMDSQLTQYILGSRRFLIKMGQRTLGLGE